MTTDSIFTDTRFHPGLFEFVTRLNTRLVHRLTFGSIYRIDGHTCNEVIDTTEHKIDGTGVLLIARTKNETFTS
jgi:hypothetical protein